MRTVYVLVEEESARAVVEAVWKELSIQFPEDVLQVKVHQGKQDLQRAIPMVVQALGRVPGSRILILHDQDSADCIELKQRLVSLVKQHSAPVKIRIICRELESWYIGDMTALGRSFPRFKPESFQAIRKFRNPDTLGSPLKELQRIVPELAAKKTSKVWLSKTVAPHMSVQSNRNVSFNQFIGAILSLLQ